MNGDILNSDFLLETLMKNTSDSIYFKDLQSRFIMVNIACADKHGWPSPESAIGTSDFDTFAREHAELAFESEQRIIEAGEPQIGIESLEIAPGAVEFSSVTFPIWEEPAEEEEWTDPVTAT